VLEKRTNRVALDPEADHLRAVVDLLDRVGRDEAAAAREETRTHRQGVRRLGRGPVHRALDLADDPAPGVRNEEPGGAPEIEGERAHVSTVFPTAEGNPCPEVSLL